MIDDRYGPEVIVTNTQYPNVGTALPPLAVGDCIRSIENGWHGQIESTYEDGNDEDGYITMLICKGINFWTGEIDQSDIQHYAAMDVCKANRFSKSGDPVNMSNVL